jgi:hypothetical protein
MFDQQHGRERGLTGVWCQRFLVNIRTLTRKLLIRVRVFARPLIDFKMNRKKIFLVAVAKE